MNKLIFVAAALGISLAIGACSVDAGVGVAAAGTPCESVSCQSALASGLEVQGDDLCDSASSDAYNQLIACGCGSQSPCGDVCGDNLCTDTGETADCGDCLDQNCGPEHDTCANN